MRTLFLIVLQLAGLWVLNELGYILVGWLHLPVPGNMMGMLLLFILLATGIIRLEWIERASSFLIRHLAFFFIPVAVGLMEFGPLFLKNGPAIIGTVVVSTIVGFLVTYGWSLSFEPNSRTQVSFSVHDTCLFQHGLNYYRSPAKRHYI